MEASIEERLHVCTFRLDSLLLAVELKRVQEVLPFRAITAVPRAPKGIRGLVNLRGEIITVLDLRSRLGLATAPPELIPIHLVIDSHAHDAKVSLVFDEVGDVFEVDEGDVEAPIETISAELRGIISGVIKMKDRLLLLLDTDKAVDATHWGAHPQTEG